MSIAKALLTLKLGLPPCLFHEEWMAAYNVGWLKLVYQMVKL